MQDANNTYQSEYPAITDVQSRETHNLVLLYSSSTGNEWRALAFQTNQTLRRTEYVDEVSTLDAGDSLDFGMLQEDGHEVTVSGSDASADRLRVADQRDETLVEYGIAVDGGDAGDDIHVGIENPTGSLITGLQGERTRGFDAEDLADNGFVRADHTVSEDGLPTTALSAGPDQGVIRFDSDENGHNPTRIGLHNAGDVTVTPSVYAVGATYRVTNVTDESTIRDMVWGRNVNRRVLTYGGLDNSSPNLPDAWRDGRVTLTSGEVQDVLRGA